MGKFSILYKYLIHQLLAKSKYRLHSPFLFEFVNEVLEDDRYYYAFDEIEELRKKLLQNDEAIQIEDFGAGSHKLASSRRKISDITLYSGIPMQQGRFLFRLARHYQPNYILELGTSLGLSALYLSKGKPDALTVSLEGSKNLSKLANEHFKLLNAEKATTINGEFSITLPKVLAEFPQLDLVHIDGNHREGPTLKYFETCLEKAHTDSIFVFDDIHWSSGMENAWGIIKSHPQVKISVDLFYKGLIFFKKEVSKPIHINMRL